MFSNAPNPVYRWIDMLATAFMCYAGFNALFYVIWYGVFTRVPFLFVWGAYYPTAYNVLTYVAFYFLFRYKFGWQSAFMFMFTWAFNDLLFNIENDSYNWVKFIHGGLYPDGALVYYLKMGIEGSIGLVGAMFLHLRLNLKFGVIKYAGLAWNIIATGYAMFVGYPTPAMSGFTSDTLINFLAFTSVVGLLMFLYQAVEIKEVDSMPREAHFG